MRLAPLRNTSPRRSAVLPHPVLRMEVMAFPEMTGIGRSTLMNGGRLGTPNGAVDFPRAVAARRVVTAVETAAEMNRVAGRRNRMTIKTAVVAEGERVPVAAEGDRRRHLVQPTLEGAPS